VTVPGHSYTPFIVKVKGQNIKVRVRILDESSRFSSFCCAMLCKRVLCRPALSVRLSRSCILSKQINMSSKLFHHRVVPVVFVWQNTPCRVQRQHAAVVHHLHRLLSAARLSTGSAVVHCLHSGLCSYSGEARHISTRVCRRHAAVFILSSHRQGVSCCTAVTMHHSRPLDVCQPPQAQRGQN